MIDIKQLQILAQLIESMENAIEKTEKSYLDNDGEGYNQAKKELIETQQDIATILR